VAEPVNQLDSPTHSFKLCAMLRDEGTDSHSRGIVWTRGEFIRVSGEYHARAGEL
jgi:hypothetical protein